MRTDRVVESRKTTVYNVGLGRSMRRSHRPSARSPRCRSRSARGQSDTASSNALARRTSASAVSARATASSEDAASVTNIVAPMASIVIATITSSKTIPQRGAALRRRITITGESVDVER